MRRVFITGLFFSMFLSTVFLWAAPPEKSNNVFNIFQSVSPSKTTTVNPNVLKPVQPSIRLPKFVLPPGTFTCLSNPADAPERIVATICRTIMKCIGFPGGREATPEIQDEFANICIRDLAEGEAIQLWNNFGHEPENTFTTSQMRNEIIAGRATVNTTAFCSCMSAISSLTCPTIEASINSHTDYANFENLVPETPECGSVFGR